MSSIRQLEDGQSKRIPGGFPVPLSDVTVQALGMESCGDHCSPGSKVYTAFGLQEEKLKNYADRSQWVARFRKTRCYFSLPLLPIKEHFKWSTAQIYVDPEA